MKKHLAHLAAALAVTLLFGAAAGPLGAAAAAPTAILDEENTAAAESRLNQSWLDMEIEYNDRNPVYQLYLSSAAFDDWVYQWYSTNPAVATVDRNGLVTAQKPGKATMSREQLVSLIAADAKFIDEREDIAEYIRGLPVNEALDENQIRSGFDRFKAEKKTRELTDLANRHTLDASALQAFVDDILRRRIFDGERLSELMAPLELGWKARTQKELALMEELTPLLHKLAQGREIAGLAAYEEGR